MRWQRAWPNSPLWRLPQMALAELHRRRAQVLCCRRSCVRHGCRLPLFQHEPCPAEQGATIQAGRCRTTKQPAMVHLGQGREHHRQQGVTRKRRWCLAPSQSRQLVALCNGPRTPVNGFNVNCNNPSPWVLKNKTVLLLCTWKIFVAPKPEGPYTELPLHGSPIANSTRKGVAGNWEGRSPICVRWAQC
jgi:hypothetical protein